MPNLMCQYILHVYSPNLRAGTGVVGITRYRHRVIIKCAFRISALYTPSQILIQDDINLINDPIR